jgi:hypothetical protein
MSNMHDEHKLSTKANKHDLGTQAGGSNKPKKGLLHRAYSTYMKGREKMGTIRAAVKRANNNPLTRARRAAEHESMLQREFASTQRTLAMQSKLHQRAVAEGKIHFRKEQ